MDFQVEISQEGRGGGIVYREPGGEYSTWWEFGAGAGVLAFIAVTDPQRWDRQIPWASGRRDEILLRIASEIIRQKAPGYDCKIDENFINVVRREFT